MENFPSRDDFLADARRDFQEFYATATVQDKCRMDGLVMAHAALVVGMNTPRDGLNRASRAALERECIEAEQVFTQLREAVRACPSYAKASDGERCAIEKFALRVQMPPGD